MTEQVFCHTNSSTKCCRQIFPYVDPWEERCTKSLGRPGNCILHCGATVWNWLRFTLTELHSFELDPGYFFFWKIFASLPLKRISSECGTIILETLTVAKPFKNVSCFYGKGRFNYVQMSLPMDPSIGQMNSTSSLRNIKRQKVHKLNRAAL